LGVFLWVRLSLLAFFAVKNHQKRAQTNRSILNAKKNIGNLGCCPDYIINAFVFNYLAVKIDI